MNAALQKLDKENTPRPSNEERWRPTPVVTNVLSMLQKPRTPQMQEGSDESDAGGSDDNAGEAPKRGAASTRASVSRRAPAFEDTPPATFLMRRKRTLAKMRTYGDGTSLQDYEDSGDEGRHISRGVCNVDTAEEAAVPRTSRARSTAGKAKSTKKTPKRGTHRGAAATAGGSRAAGRRGRSRRTTGDSEEEEADEEISSTSEGEAEAAQKEKETSGVASPRLLIARSARSRGRPPVYREESDSDVDQPPAAATGKRKRAV